LNFFWGAGHIFGHLFPQNADFRANLRVKILKFNDTHIKGFGKGLRRLGTPPVAADSINEHDVSCFHNPKDCLASPAMILPGMIGQSRQRAGMKLALIILSYLFASRFPCARA
jgi:hypothetical protein